MGADGVFPAEMPEDGLFLADPLDDDTAERLLAGRVGPDDAPSGYAGVASLLQAASAPPAPEELAGQQAALATFRTHLPARRRSPARARGRTRARGQEGGRTRARGRGRGRARVVGLALAGVVAAGGLWTVAAGPSPPGLRSRAGAPRSGGAGSGAPGVVTEARPMTPPVTGAIAGAPARTSAPTPSTAGGPGVTAGGTPGHGPKPHRPGKPPKSKPKPKPAKPSPPGKPKPKHQS
jgi:hypothetical protein